MIYIETTSLEFSTKGKTDIIDITDKVQSVLHEKGFRRGQVTLFAVGSTTGLGTVEYEPGLVHHDLAEMFGKFAPYGLNYEHNKTWGDDNGASHLRSTLQGTSLVIPFDQGQMILGTWQQVIFMDFDTRPRSRKIVVQLIGSKQ